MVGLTAAQPGAWRADSRALLLLALPLILTNLAYVALTTIDIVVLGMLGAKELAAGGLAIALFNQLRTTGTGLVTGVSNLVAQANAQGDEAQVRALLVAGLFWATVSGLVFMGVLLGLRQPLTWLGQDASVVANAMDFLLIIAPGLLPCLWFQALRHFTVGLKFPGPLLAITLVSIFLTAALNYVLVFGKFGVPAYGLAGVAITSAVVFLLSFLMFFAVVLTHRRLAGYFKLSHLSFSPAAIKAVWKLGLPIAGTYASEAGFFSVLTLLIGTLGMEALAAQTVLNQIIYIVFMFSAGISHAASIHISDACGTGQYQRARQLGRLGLGLGLLVMLLFAIPYALLPEQVIGLFISTEHANNLDAVRLATTGLLIAIVLQVFDASQNIGNGILRGIGDTAGPLRISLFGYWLVGLPAAWLLGIVSPYGIFGVWAGLAIGLAATALLLIVSFERQLNALDRAGAIALS
ncbi:MATE family efflux transporter [Pseudomonas sp. WS 5111]|jgi:MATE family multidrug resistance protein|uniref:MATE family efflux transporter n=1 Tax=unclassified Pseudomonas TaxID=196821 RepID=UPI00147641E1|nr:MULTISPECIES: MATE family efflux transporter [unclassified Pseudomonas]NMX68810.1 MATE family efflux transporter [Pseudomonas sp. WS 5111]NMX88714.1 MATE family efflux transporter [Pseudomonas sp. WS 5010]